MKNNKSILIALILFFSVNELIGQVDHLNPAGNFFDIGNRQLEYYSKVRQILYDGLTDTPEIRYLILPSFSPESVLEIEYDKKSDAFFLVYHIGEKMIWNNKDWSNTNVLKYKKGITKEHVDVIKSLFKNAIIVAKYPEVPKNPVFNGLEVHRIMLDGENYYYSYLENKSVLRSGMVRSPKKGTKMDRLVVIGNRLIELAKSEVSTVILNEELKTDILNLTNELKINDR